MSASPSSSAVAVDVIVVGAGAAGLYAALTAADDGAQVLLISATPLAQTSSYWAQGGLAAVLAVDDSPAIHLADTLIAGRDLVRPAAAQALVDEAPGAVAELERIGVRFDADRNGNLSLGLEGGHSRRRVVHAGGSATGRRVVRQLSALVVEHPRIEVWEQTRVASLWCDTDGACVGVVCQNDRAARGRATILATGGTAALWSRTTNPPGAIGIGSLLALAAGAVLADLELVQFHPTAVTGIAGREGFLITEAIRGEGATLHGPDGERFVDELAPRDEVARAVDGVMRANGSTHVGLDMRRIDPARFPNVVAALRESGLDPAHELVPVAPAAHYCMGGVKADLTGATTVAGLFAVGETACTGLHGANRLASNSLSECFVFGRRAARAALDQQLRGHMGAPPPPAAIPVPDPATRSALSRNAGIVRVPAELSELLDSPHPLVRLIASSALLRAETRGAHCRADALERDPALDGHHTVVDAAAKPAFERWD